MAELGGNHLYFRPSFAVDWEETEDNCMDYACIYQPPTIQCIFNLTDLKITNVNTDKRTGWSSDQSDSPVGPVKSIT